MTKLSNPDPKSDRDPSIIELLAMPGEADIDFDPSRPEIFLRSADFSLTDGLGGLAARARAQAGPNPR